MKMKGGTQCENLFVNVLALLRNPDIKQLKYDRLNLLGGIVLREILTQHITRKRNITLYGLFLLDHDWITWNPR